MLVTAADQRLRFMDARSGKILAEIPERLVLAEAISPDGRWLATGRYDGVTLWDLEKREKTATRWPVAAAESVEFSPDGRFLAAGSNDGMVHVWDVETGGLEWSCHFPPPHLAEALRRLKIMLATAWAAALVIIVGWKFLRPSRAFAQAGPGARV